ncbi:hypothetical protein [Corynebacterium sp. A21]|uniref:hypothetical protein n=1 Tax=Corynebacterium sp. A21 TaxID=3457318 RepID=UPI003FD2805D
MVSHSTHNAAARTHSLLDILLTRLPEEPAIDHLEEIAAACLGCYDTDDIIIREILEG